MKYVIRCHFEINMTPEELAERCNKDKVCPLERFDVPCPFPEGVCYAVTERDWENLKESN